MAVACASKNVTIPVIVNAPQVWKLAMSQSQFTVNAGSTVSLASSVVDSADDATGVLRFQCPCPSTDGTD